MAKGKGKARPGGKMSAMMAMHEKAEAGGGKKNAGGKKGCK